MHSEPGIKYWTKRSIRLLLLILFLGYYGGTTYFTHVHIVNGKTIVHSHPFNKEKGNDPSKQPHSGKELLLIQLLSGFVTTVFAAMFAGQVIADLLEKIFNNPPGEGYAEPGGFSNYPLRAPPLYLG